MTDPVTSLATFSEAAACSAAAAVRAAALRRLCAGPRLLSPGWRQAVILANLVRERDFEVLKKSAKVDKVYINIYSDR